RLVRLQVVDLVEQQQEGPFTGGGEARQDGEDLFDLLTVLQGDGEVGPPAGREAELDRLAGRDRVAAQPAQGRPRRRAVLAPLGGQVDGAVKAIEDVDDGLVGEGGVGGAVRGDQGP